MSKFFDDMDFKPCNRLSTSITDAPFQHIYGRCVPVPVYAETPPFVIPAVDKVMAELTPEMRYLLDHWVTNLSEEQIYRVIGGKGK